MKQKKFGKKGKLQKQEKEVENNKQVQLAHSLDQQLGLSANQIGQEYDRSYYYLGQRFAQGDRKPALYAASYNTVIVALT
jgi:hypothetical protein